MPPKKAQGGGSKVAVDKTFGMKNKKGGKAQKQVQMIQQQQQQAGKSKEQLAREKQKAAEKKAQAEAAKMLASDPLFAIVQPKVPFGVDPKNVTCAFWKAGKCDKGSRCKYGHSLDAGRKVEKKDLYTDTREEEKKNDTMDKWDLEKLGEVVMSKHGNPKSTTDKVCKFFLQAVEEGKYGWFWECPNGREKCMYRHRLPPGFVLKSQKKELEELEKTNEISLEDFLETERHKLGTNLTPVTAESFAKWKKERVDKKAAEADMLKAKKAAQAQANKMAGLSGREMFTLNPDMFADEEGGDDDGEFDMQQYFKGDWEQGRQSDEEGDKPNDHAADDNEKSDNEKSDNEAEQQRGDEITSTNGDPTTKDVTNGVDPMSVKA